MVESDDGFSFEVGKNTITYRQGDRVATIGSEILATEKIGVWDQQIRWESPDDPAWMDVASRHLILGRMIEAFASQGWELEV